MGGDIVFELKRKAIHIFAFLYIGIYYLFFKLYGHEGGVLALVGVLVLFLIIDYFRIVRKVKIGLFDIFWRDSERDKLGGNVYFVLGAIVAFAVFDFNIAIAVMLMAIFGDMAAALIGIKWGKNWIVGLKSRAWEGVIAELVVNLIIGFLLLNNIFVILGIAITATFVETVFEYVDDNLSIPVVAGFVGQVLLNVL